MVVYHCCSITVGHRHRDIRERHRRRSIARNVDSGERFHVAQQREADDVESLAGVHVPDRKSTRLNSSHLGISYAVFCLKKKALRYSSRSGLSVLTSVKESGT